MIYGEISDALKGRLLTVAGVIPVSWPGLDFVPGAEYIEFRHAPVGRFDNTGAATVAYQEGIALITAVVKAGIGEKRVEQIADTIRAGFPMGLRITAGSGKVLITKPADPVPGFTDGAYYRLPVRVDYTTE